MTTSDVLQKGLVLAEKIELTQQIGEGGQAKVWEAKELDTGRAVAAKLVVLPPERRSEVSNQVIDAEIKKLSQLSGQFLVIMLYAIYDQLPEGQIVLGYTMPLAAGGTLASNADFREQLRINRELLNQTMLSIARGVSTIHAASYVHGDIKPSNVLLFPDQKLTWARVSDLGATYEVFGVGPAMDYRYAAPERFRDIYSTAYDKKRSDIYSLGMLFFELLTEQYAYGDRNFYEFAVHDYQRLHEESLPDWGLVPKPQTGLVAMLKKMLDKDWDKRPDISDVVELLEEKFTEAQARTATGNQKPHVYFTPDTLLWNPAVHKIMGYSKKIFLLNSSNAFDLAESLRARLLSEMPNHGFTLFVSFGAADMVLTTWERSDKETVHGIIDQMTKLAPRIRVEEHMASTVLYKESEAHETWDQKTGDEIARTIVANTKARPTPDIENYLRSQRFTFGKLTRVAHDGAVRLLLKITATEPMEREYSLLIRAIREFLNFYYEEAGGENFPYPYRIYSESTSKKWATIKKYILVELYGADIYWCSRGITGIIRAVNGVSVPTEQHFEYSSHIQFEKENILESEDGALANILTSAAQ